MITEESRDVTMEEEQGVGRGEEEETPQEASRKCLVLQFQLEFLFPVY
jgi:hypothetical protein